MIRKIFSFLIILPLLFVPLFCCCSQEALAASLGISHEDCCNGDDDGDAHSTKHADSKGDHEHACNCGHTINDVIEKTTISQANLTFSYNSFPETLFSNALPNNLIRSFYLAYLGPPGKASSVPLYTLYHSLRI